MTGAAYSQAIWVLVNGVTTTATLGELYAAYVAGGLGAYKIWYVDPLSYEESTEKDPIVLTSVMSVNEAVSYGVHQQVIATSEDGLTVTMGATGSLMDVSDWDPNHLNANFSINTKNYVTALESLGGKPGNQKFVRRVVTYRMAGSCEVITLPTPNMIADTGFVIMS